jgi:putative FmdB family regulatory protein
MPIYEYRCTSCGHTLEVIQKLSDKPLTKCTECSGKLEKLISRSAFLLKGGGWYAQGYGASNGGSGSKSSKPAGEGGKSDGAKAEGGKSDGGKSDGGKNDGGTKKAAAGGCGSGACGCH